MLTASKLSTVAMLVMAALLHFSVSAVPMEKPGPAGEAPAIEVVLAAKAPALSDYKPLGPGQPSPQAQQELEKIMFVTTPATKRLAWSDKDFGKEDYFSRMPPEMIEQVRSQLNNDEKSSLALANKRHHSHQVIDMDGPREMWKELNAELDRIWAELGQGGALPSNDQPVNVSYWTTSNKWTQAIDRVRGPSKIKDCPVDLLRFYTNLQPKSANTEYNLDQQSDTSNPQWHTGETYNICSMVVNNAYQWLLKLMSLPDDDVHIRILSVMFQLKQFSREERLVSKLEEMFPLFVRLAQANPQTAPAYDNAAHVLITVVPSLIPVFNVPKGSLNNALMLEQAFREHEERSEVKLMIGDQNILDTVKPGDFSEFKTNIIRAVVSTPVPRYADILEETCGFISQFPANQNLRLLMNRMFDNPVDYFALLADDDMKYSAEAAIRSAHPLGLLMPMLNQDEFKKVYDEMYQLDTNPFIIGTVGKSRSGTNNLEYVFTKLFGAPGEALDDDIQFQGLPLDTSHLVSVAHSCAYACTKQNWQAFNDLFVDKFKVTDSLYGEDEDLPLSQRLSELIVARSNELSTEFEQVKLTTPDKATEASTNDINDIIHRLQQLGSDLK